MCLIWRTRQRPNGVILGDQSSAFAEQRPVQLVWVGGFPGNCADLCPLCLAGAAELTFSQAAKRARQIYAGADPMVEPENDKPTVLALREIADAKVTAEILHEVPELIIEDVEEPLEPGDPI